MAMTPRINVADLANAGENEAPKAGTAPAEAPATNARAIAQRAARARQREEQEREQLIRDTIAVTLMREGTMAARLALLDREPFLFLLDHVNETQWCNLFAAITTELRARYVALTEPR